MSDKSKLCKMFDDITNLRSVMLEGSSIEYSFDILLSLICKINKYEAAVPKGGEWDSIFDHAFIDGMIEIFSRSAGLSTKKGALDIWYFCMKSECQILQKHISNNRHLIERLIVSEAKPLVNYSDFHNALIGYHFKMKKPEKTPIFVCAMPKSGSISLSSILAKYFDRATASGHNRNSFTHGLEIDLLRNHIAQGDLIHSHLRPGLDFIVLLKSLNLKPIILFRNIFDAIKSRKDHFQGDALQNSFRSTVQRQRQNNLEFSAYAFAYEYISFVHQWQAAANFLGVKILYFEDCTKDWKWL